MKDLKYLIAYITPLFCFLGLYLGGWWSPGSFYLAFVLVPILEFFLPGTTRNLTPEEEQSKTKSVFFDVLLYLNVPILYFLLLFYFFTLQNGGIAPAEVIAMTLNIGIALGSMGINVGHELGHRTSWYERFMAKILLLPNLYMHFIIEHNRGHHKWVGTPEDPASARLGESLYAFWWRSVTQSYRHAWKLEKERLDRLEKPFWSIQNEMIVFSVIQLTYLFAVGLACGWIFIPYAIAAAIVGFLLLETVNYIEHYGLQRKKLPSGRYEKVEFHHSWNSNHEIGRILLYELTRHADHHYKASRKYQVLRHFDGSPQLPYGYPTSMLLSLVPPLWFRKMRGFFPENNTLFSGKKPL